MSASTLSASFTAAAISIATTVTVGTRTATIMLTLAASSSAAARLIPPRIGDHAQVGLPALRWPGSCLWEEPFSFSNSSS